MRRPDRIRKPLALFSMLMVLVSLLGTAMPTSPVQATPAVDVPVAAPVPDGPVTSVVITGPTFAQLNTTYTFTSTAGPPTATLPIAHVWRATDQSPQTFVTGLTSTIAYSWTLPGIKTITVTVTGGGGVASDSLQVVVGTGIPPVAGTLTSAMNLGTGSPVWFTIQISPFTLTVPITYTFASAGQPSRVMVRNTVWGNFWAVDRGWYNDYAMATYTWNIGGVKTVYFTATNSAGTLTSSVAITLSQSPIITVTGPASGQVSVPYTFTTTAGPPTVTTPISYSWYTTQQPFRYVGGGLSDMATYTWTTPGKKAIYVTAQNAVGSSHSALLFDIPTVLPVLVPTLSSVGSGTWSSPATWNLGRAPLVTDVVLINTGHTVTTSTPIHISSLVNEGTLRGPANASLVITATNMISNSGLIKGADNAVLALPPLVAPDTSNPACNGTSGTSGANVVVSTAQTYNNGTIQAGNGLNGGKGGDVSWFPSPNTTLWNDTAGVIQAGNGGNGLPAGGGGPGGSVTVSGKPLDNDGLIRAGNGGSGDQCGGNGGDANILGENTTNTGTIRSGNGGNTTDNVAGAQGGDGGNAHVWGKFFTFVGFLVNLGTIQAGNGGNGNPGATVPQDAGCGGNLIFMAAPNIFLTGGTHAGGITGIPSAGGLPCIDGSVIIDPGEVLLSGDTRITGGNVLLYGGDGWTLNLSHLDEVVISATGSITIAVGAGGTLDLSGNASPILQAGGQVYLYADQVLLDPGVPLFAVTGPNVVTGPSRILHGVSVIAPGLLFTQPGGTLTVHAWVLNTAPVTDTFDLAQSNTAGWSAGGLPAQATIGPLGNQEIVFDLAVPAGVPGGTVNAVSLSAASQADPAAVGEAEIIVLVQSPPASVFRVYLPIVAR